MKARCFVFPLLWATTGLAFCACSSSSVAPQEPSTSEVYRIGREGFVQELVFPQATQRTPVFDDYTNGSYHVEKLDLLNGVRERKRAGTPIVAFIVRGPAGPLWAYEVNLFLREAGGIRVNTVVMPHARITFKSTKLVTHEALHELFDAIGRSEAVASGPPPVPSEQPHAAEDLPANVEWSFDFLAVRWIDEHEQVLRTTALRSFAETIPVSVVHLHELVSAVTAGGITTYSSDISEEESIYRDRAP